MKIRSIPVLALMLVAGCDDGDSPKEPAIAEGIFATPGQIRPSATAEQRATFERGEAVAKRRFTPEEGLGPLFNVTFCGACHEKPVFGGGAGHYRNFSITGRRIDEGTFIATGDNGGVLTAYSLDADQLRPRAGTDDDVFAQRNPVPFFGLGLLAEINEEAILANEDPDDADGDGISGRANYDRGFVGRFGLKAQTVDIEGFIRGPINNHVGITSDPLSQEDKARLPVPSANEDAEVFEEAANGLEVQRFHQAAAPSEPLADDDDVADPEMKSDDLFDLVSWAMLLAAPKPAEPTEQSERGRERFEKIGCTGCHVPALAGPRGAIPAYTDLLLHDMGEEVADGLPMGLASGSEFRTSPLWGVGVGGPYFHDGRADTLDDAIRVHGGEAKRSRDAFVNLDDAAQADVIAFLNALGGAEIATAGLLLPDALVPGVGESGGPARVLTEEERTLWLAGRAVFDRDMPLKQGVGPLFNGDSCRACHFDPVFGGAGPLDVNVMRHGFTDAGEPPAGTTLFKFHVPGGHRPEVSPDRAAFFEPRQTPTALGVGVISRIPPESIVANADPDDLDGDGVRGVAHVLSDGRIGRLGWKAQVPSAEEFVRDAMTGEIGFTLPVVEGQSFGLVEDDDAYPDPELPMADYEAIVFFLENLAPPAPVKEHRPGLTLFTEIGCVDCHTPRLAGMDPDAPPAYTNLLLHAVGPADLPGIDDGMATAGFFRTPPLWGISGTAPYMHDGSATTLADAIDAHGGEGTGSRDAYSALDEAGQAAVLEFLGGL